MWTYSPAEFEKLRTIRDAKALLATSREEIVTVGNLICRYGLHELVGVNLLHRHFPLRSDERLLRRYSINSAEMRPATVTTDIVPYAWKLRQSNGAYSLVPLEFIEPRSGDGSIEAVAHVLTHSREFLFAVGSVLSDLNLLDAFGLVILNSGAIRVEHGEILLERTDHSKRIVTLRPCSIAAVGGDITETTWGFSVRSEGDYCANCRKSLHSMREWQREEIARYKTKVSTQTPAWLTKRPEFTTPSLPDMSCCGTTHCEACLKSCSAFCCGVCAPETH